MVWESCLAIPRKETITPMVTTPEPLRLKFGALRYTRSPPTMARTTYIRLPTLFKIGIRELP